MEFKIVGTQNIMGKELKIIEGGFGEGKKILTVHQIAAIHNVEVKELNRLINENLTEFEEELDLLNLLKVGSNHLKIKETFGIELPAVTKYFYILSEQGYMALVSLMRTDKAKEIRKQIRRDYFAMREQLSFKVPTTFREALLLAADQQLIIEQQAETITGQQLLLDSQKEKVEVYDALANSEKCLSMKNARHLLGFITKGEFKKFLILAHCMNPISGTLKAEYIQRGYFKSYLIKNEFIPEYYVTEKGLLWLQKRKQKLDL